MAKIKITKSAMTIYEIEHYLTPGEHRDLYTAAGQTIAAETGLQHRPVAEGERVSGVYRRSVMLASGRFAILDDGMAFRLVPWKRVIDQRLGQHLAATVRDGGALWEIGGSRLMTMFQLPPTERAAKYRAGESPKERRNMAMKLLGEA